MLRKGSIRALAAFLLGTPTFLQAQTADDDLLTPFYAGGTIFVTEPTGEFGNYVGNGFGAMGHLMYQPGGSGVFALRLDGGFLTYGNETKRVPFSSTVGGRVSVDVTTSNNIVLFSVGPQLMLPDGQFRPYVNAAVGLSYFFTQSSVENLSGGESLAQTTNFDDATLSYGGGAGLYIPIHRGRALISLDLGLRYLVNGETQYLREGSIQDGPDNTITISPILSETNFLSFQIGATVRLPRPEHEDGWR